ncbi:MULTISPECIES: HTTM domain-containing protein [unclassified Streptomyces]|uniref:HTTM domain-containing protein n=1 Tax=unclassified Streptomyces TaxID=2593676 RepID=UPI0004B43497|nr:MULTISPECIES: HTTM domain-containing protein [unclassified Streptomyces]MYR75421.1 HTTM domain-containing protein [Streptomyces sp. SID4925]MYY14166.1 HTTM domain-containing protein [Streptomyces sp. SID4912]SBU88270.1 Vitamin K-dependent gamma-carboxylase [Streptomyces sp. OspMP-M45]SCD43875.1 Vitamin K-dependent gamma-carboxylase [Streptomyces sp. DpondAA-D4]
MASDLIRHKVAVPAHRAWALLTERPLSLYAVSVLRIGYGLLYLLFLLREFSHRDEIWGPGSPWTPALARQLFDQTGWVSVLTLSDSPVYFEVCYAAALVVCVLFLLGWRTRAVSVLFAVVVASFHARAIFMTDGGDNLVLLMALYLTLTASGRRWSLDARRARRRTAAATRWSGTLPQLRASRRTLVAALHNCGLLVIALQVCFLYGAAGLYKVQGGTWGAGTALHFVLNLELFQPWPALSHWADGQEAAIAVVGYLTVLLQVAFPFVLFGRLKYPVLTMLFGMHLGIALLMGLPLFSGAMIVADAVFLPDRFYVAVGNVFRWARRKPGGPTGGPEARQGAVPKQAGRLSPTTGACPQAEPTR